VPAARASPARIRRVGPITAFRAVIGSLADGDPYDNGKSCR